MTCKEYKLEDKIIFVAFVRENINQNEEACDDIIQNRREVLNYLCIVIDLPTNCIH